MALSAFPNQREIAPAQQSRQTPQATRMTTTAQNLSAKFSRENNQPTQEQAKLKNTKTLPKTLPRQDLRFSRENCILSAWPRSNNGPMGKVDKWAK